VARTKSNKKLYERMRASGVRKKVARQLTGLTRQAKGGKRPPKPLREAVDRLESTVAELRGHVDRADRKTAARKAARTRRAKAEKRSAAAKKGARRRAKA
jgi:hypothetical protein